LTFLLFKFVRHSIDSSSSSELADIIIQKIFWTILRNDWIILIMNSMTEIKYAIFFSAQIYRPPFQSNSDIIGFEMLLLFLSLHLDIYSVCHGFILTKRDDYFWVNFWIGAARAVSKIGSSLNPSHHQEI